MAYCMVREVFGSPFWLPKLLRVEEIMEEKGMFLPFYFAQTYLFYTFILTTPRCSMQLTIILKYNT